MDNKKYKKKIEKILPFSFMDKINRIQFVYKSLKIVLIVGLITFLIWFPHMVRSHFEIYLFLSKASALIGLCLLSLTIILSLRNNFVESFFGGLDKVYKAHHFVGIIAAIVILLHPIFLIVRAIPDWDSTLVYIVPGMSTSITYGILSLYLMLILLAFTLIIKLPYKIWHFTHHFMGVVLILATWHTLASARHIIEFPLLGIWVLLFASIGIISYFYTLFLYRIIGPKFRASVEYVKIKGDITEIKLKTIDKKIKFHPGQFIFIKFPTLENSFEMFPFSISSSNSEDLIRISAKMSGDFTSHKLPKINVGDKIYLYGPYGKFGEKYLFEKKDMIWIAGGIGVTPFISMLKHKNSSKYNKINFIWTCKDEKSAVYDKEIKNIIKENDNINYILWLSKERGRLSAKAIMDLCHPGEKINDKLIFLCGPNKMMMELSDQFIKMGAKPNNIIFEDFNLI